MTRPLQLKSCFLALFLKLQCLRLLPGEALVGEMSVLRRSAVYRIGQIQLFNDHTWSQIEVVSDDLDQFLAGPAARTIGLDEQAQRF